MVRKFVGVVLLLLILLLLIVIGYYKDEELKFFGREWEVVLTKKRHMWGRFNNNAII